MKKKIISVIIIFSMCVFICKPIKTSASVTAVAGSVALGLIFGEILNGSTSEVIGGLIECGGEGIDFLMNKDGVFDDWVENNLFNTIAEYDEEQKRIKSLTMSLDDFEKYQEYVLSLFGATAENNYTFLLKDFNFNYIANQNYTLDVTIDYSDSGYGGKCITPACYYNDEIYIMFSSRLFLNKLKGKSFNLTYIGGWNFSRIINYVQIIKEDAGLESYIYYDNNKVYHSGVTLNNNFKKLLSSDYFSYDDVSTGSFFYIVSDDIVTVDALSGMIITNKSITANKNKLQQVIAPVLDFPGVNADDITITFPVTGEGDLSDVVVGTDTVSVTLDKLLEAELDTDIKLDLDIDVPTSIIHKFPFCLPFDFHRLMTIFVAEPEAPKVDVPFQMEGVFDYTVSFDLSEYNWLADIVRFFVWILFVFILIFATRKLIWK